MLRAETGVALDALRRVAHDLHLRGRADGREDLIAAALLVGELGAALGARRLDAAELAAVAESIADAGA